jgi:hypothetical protein
MRLLPLFLFAAVSANAFATNKDEGCAARLLGAANPGLQAFAKAFGDKTPDVKSRLVLDLSSGAPEESEPYGDDIVIKEAIVPADWQQFPQFYFEPRENNPLNLRMTGQPAREFLKTSKSSIEAVRRLRTGDFDFLNDSQFRIDLKIPLQVPADALAYTKEKFARYLTLSPDQVVRVYDQLGVFEALAWVQSQLGDARLSLAAHGWSLSRADDKFNLHIYPQIEVPAGVSEFEANALLYQEVYRHLQGAQPAPIQQPTGLLSRLLKRSYSGEAVRQAYLEHENSMLYVGRQQGEASFMADSSLGAIELMGYDDSGRSDF